MSEVLLAILAGWLFADFLSGLLHWCEDRIAGDGWPILGPLVFAPNRLHHAQPMAFTRGTWIKRNGTAIGAALLIAGSIALVLGMTLGRDTPDFVWVALGSATIGGAMANQVHCWAHVPHRAPGIVQAAQSIGLVQSRRHHARHHAAPQRSRYCILTDWLNPLLDWTGAWRGLERVMPRRWLV